VFLLAPVASLGAEVAARPRQSFRVEQVSPTELIVFVTPPELKIIPFVQSRKVYQALHMPGWGVAQRPGHAMLPQTALLVEVPAGANIDVRIVERQFDVVDELTVVPAPSVVEQADSIRYRYEEAPAVYERDAYEPQPLVSLGGEGTIRGHRMVRIEIHPVQYNPVEKRLRVYTSLVVRLRAAAGPLNVIQDLTDLLSADVARVSPPPQHPTLHTPASYDVQSDYLKLFVSEDGVYAVTYEDLLAAGFPVNSVDASLLKIVNRGQQIPIYLAGPQNGSFGPGNSIYFYGQRQKNDSTYFDFYSDENIYWLRASGDPGLRYRQPNSNAAHKQPEAFYQHTLHLEEENIFHRSDGITAIGPDEGWIWRYLFADQHAIINFDISSLQVGVAPCTLRVRLHSTTRDPASPDHHVTVQINGEQVAEAFFEERQELLLDVPFSSALLSDGQNKFELHLVPDTGAQVNQIYLDWLEVSYPRGFAALSDELVFRSPVTTPGQTEFSLFNFRDSTTVIFSPLTGDMWAPSAQKTSIYQMESAGFDDGSFVRAAVDFEYFFSVARGHHLLVRDPETGVVEEHRYDTFASQDEANAMAAFIQQLPENTVVLAGIADEGSANMTEAAYLALESLGSALTRQVGSRDSWALIGRKGAPIGSVPETLVPRFSGSAIAADTLAGASALRYAATFRDSVAPGELYIAVSDSGVRHVQRMEMDRPSDLRSPSNGADYIIITHPDFAAQARQLADYRASHNGFRTVVVDVRDIYDEFNFGIQHPQAIKDFLQFTMQSWQAPAPQFVVLFGDASWDPKKNMPESVKVNFIPSYGILVSDNWYVSLDGPDDVLADMFVGRLPVTTPDEAATVVEKIIAYEQLPHAAWNKRFMFMNGGINDTEQSVFRAQAKALIEHQVEASPFVGAALQFNKTSKDGITQRLRRVAAKAIKSGVVWVNFLGHSGSSVWDIDIGRPDEWQNEEVFPFITGMSCHSARFANPIINSLSEEFFLSPMGACGYWGSTGFGFITQDFFLLEGLFSAVTLDTVRSLGEATTLAKVHLWQVLGDASRNRRVLNQYALIGDPALRLKIAEQPELAISQADVSFSSPLLLLADSSTTVTAKVHNYGYVPTDSVQVAFSASGAAGADQVFGEFRIPPFGDTDSLDVAWRFPEQAGEYAVQVSLDPHNTIPEADEANNMTQVQVNLFVSDLTLIKPMDFGVIHTDRPELVTGNSRGDLSGLTYMFEVDTSVTFSSGLLQQSGAVAEGKFVTVWQPVLPQPGFYHWRVRTFDGQTYGPWASASFEYRTDSVGRWKQAIAAQFAANVLQDVEIRPAGDVGLAVRKTMFEVQSAGLADGRMAAIFVNDENISQPKRGHNLAVFSEIDGSFLVFQNFDTYVDPANAEAMAQFINALPDGRIVAVGINDDGTGSMTENAYQALESIGSQFTRQVGFRDSWAIIGRKGAAVGSVPEAWRVSGTGQVTVLDTLERFARRGFMVSGAIGPAIHWRTAAFEFSPGTLTEELTFSILGRNKTTGQTDTLMTGLATTAPVDLAATIDESTYPTLQMLAAFSTQTGLATPLLHAWTVDFAPPPDLVLGRGSLRFSQDTLVVGNDVRLSLEYGNFGAAAADSFTVELRIVEAGGGGHSVQHIRVPGADVDGIGKTSAFVPTGDFQGKVSVTARLDALDEIPEINENNNQVERHFWVASDTIQPAVRITIDGQDIGSGEFVSAMPEILIEVREQAAWSVEDTSRVTILLDGVRVSFGGNPGEAEFMPQLNPTEDVRVLIVLRPQLDDGDHRLEVVVKDASENLTFVERQFVVSSEFIIANVMNYPNPFAQMTEFTYVLTQPADEVKIKIYTVAGRLIRELEFAPANAGFNALHWDGRDDDADFLANGVYLYKIIARRGNQQVAALDKFVVMR